jgi:hypothetical protein
VIFLAGSSVIGLGSVRVKQRADRVFEDRVLKRILEFKGESERMETLGNEKH